MKKNFLKNNKGGLALSRVEGFTLVEVMIAIGLFTVIMTIGIGAILGVNSTHRKTQSLRTVIDNLSFVMEDMARSMRLGDYFVCEESTVDPIGPIDVTSNPEPGEVQSTQDGENCKSIAFEPYWDPQPAVALNQVMYFIQEDNFDQGSIFKKEFDMGWNDDLIAVTPAEIDIDVERSGFTVVGSALGDGVIPRIKIILVGTVRLAGVDTEFNMQTTVSQRFLRN